MGVQSTVEVVLPSGANTTVEEFMAKVNSTTPERRQNIVIADLIPLDESKLGAMVSEPRGLLGLGTPERVWRPAHSEPKPINCQWNPSPDDPSQTELIKAAGLVNGAQLAVISVSRTVG